MSKLLIWSFVYVLISSAIISILRRFVINKRRRHQEIKDKLRVKKSYFFLFYFCVTIVELFLIGNGYYYAMNGAWIFVVILFILQGFAVVLIKRVFGYLKSMVLVLKEDRIEYYEGSNLKEVHLIKNISGVHIGPANIILYMRGKQQALLPNLFCDSYMIQDWYEINMK